MRKGSRHSQPRTGTPARRRRTGPPPQRKGSPGLWPQQPPPPGVTAPAESCPAQTSQFPDCGDRSARERTDGLRSDTGTRRRVQMQIGPSRPASGPRVPRGSRRRARVAPRGGSEARGSGGTQAPRRTSSPGGLAAGGPGPGSGSPPRSSCSERRRGARRKRRRKGTARRSPSPYRVVYPPHQDAEQRIAGPKELHFLRDEMLLLGLGLARQDGGPQVAGGRHGRRLCPLHRRAPEAGDPPSLHAGPGRQLHPPRRRPQRAVSPLRPLVRSSRSARGARLARLAKKAALGSRPGSAPAPARPRLRAQPAAGPGAPRAASALGAGVMTQIGRAHV